MKAAILIYLAMVLLIFITAGSVSGCAAVGALPTVKYCDDVKYERRGNVADLEARGCVIPRGTDLPGL